MFVRIQAALLAGGEMCRGIMLYTRVCSLFAGPLKLLKTGPTPDDDDDDDDEANRSAKRETPFDLGFVFKIRTVIPAPGPLMCKQRTWRKWLGVASLKRREGGAPNYKLARRI